MSPEEKDYDSIVELLKKDYLLKAEDNLKQKIGEIVHDFTNRGLYSSSHCIGKQLQAHFEFIDKMIEHIEGVLKQNFTDIPLQHFKEKLLSIVDEEYKKLAPFANSFLVQTGLASESNFKSAEKRINGNKEKTKQKIETRFAILDKQNIAPKNNRESAKAEMENTELEGAIKPKQPEILGKILWVLKYGIKHWKLILLVLLIFAGGFILSNFNQISKMWHLPKSKTLNNYGRTALYVRTKKRVDDIYKKIDNEKLSPWIFIHTNKMPPVTKYDGRVIQMKGVLYAGTAITIFWSDDFIPPFIEDAMVEVFDSTIEECRKNNIDPEPHIQEANNLLDGFIWRIYNRMADIDKRLRGANSPEKVSRKDISWEIKKMQKRLKEHYDAAILLASKDGNTN